MTPPSLRELQNWMKWAVTDPNGTLKPEPRPRAGPWIQQDSLSSARQRLNVYADAYFLRLHEVLEQDFPRTRQLLGDSFFQNFVRAYLQECPSKVFNINEVGQHLSTFAGQLVLSDDFPFLPSLVDLEWQMVRLTWNPSPGSGFSLANLGDQDPETIYLTLNPSLRFLKSYWPLDQLEKAPPQKHYVPFPLEADFILFDGSNGSSVQALSATQFFILQLIDQKTDLGKIFELYSIKFPESDPQEILIWFQNWVSDRVITDYSLQQKEAL
jgi:hypothetical protein